MHIHRAITPERVTDAIERSHTSLDNPGFCISCGAEADGVEPDATEYECESCGCLEVYGAEQLLLIMAAQHRATSSQRVPATPGSHLTQHPPTEQVSNIARHNDWRRHATVLRQHAEQPHLTETARATLLREATAADAQADIWLCAALVFTRPSPEPPPNAPGEAS